MTVRGKHLGLASAALLLLGLGLAGAYALFALPGGGQVVRTKLPPLPKVPPVPAGVIEEMDRLQPKLARLAVPADSGDARVDLRLLGYRPMVADSRRDGAPGTPGTREQFPEHIVSMAFVSPRHSFCVVDGALRRPGDTLANGTRVQRIVPGKVLLEWQGIEAWFEVENIREGAAESTG